MCLVTVISVFCLFPGWGEWGGGGGGAVIGGARIFFRVSLFRNFNPLTFFPPRNVANNKIMKIDDGLFANQFYLQFL